MTKHDHDHLLIYPPIMSGTVAHSIPYTESQLKWNLMMRYYESSDPQFEDRLPYVFQRLRSSNASQNFLLTWTTNIRTVLINIPPDSFSAISSSYDVYSDEHRVNHRFLISCLAAGMVGAMLDVSELEAQRQNAVSYMAIQIITYITPLVNESQRAMIQKEFELKKGFGILLRQASHRRVNIVQRATAVECLEKVLSYTLLVEELTMGEIKELLVACTAYAIRDHQHILDDLKRPENQYMHNSIRYSEGTGKGGYDEPRTLGKTLQIAPVWFSNNQDESLMVCIDALCRRRHVTRQECLEMIQQSPKIIDNLLHIMSREASAGVQEQACDGAAAVILCFLMMLPQYYAISGEIDAEKELEDAMHCNKILFQHPRSLQMLIRARNKAAAVDPVAIAVKTRQQWSARGDEDMLHHALPKLSPNTGRLGICTLRILNNFTLIPDAPAPVFIALLPIAYTACARAPTESHIASSASRGPGPRYTDEYLMQQRQLYEVRLRPAEQSSAYDPLLDRIQLFVAPETIVGPTLLFRLLRKLAATGYTLERLRELKRIPPNTPDIDETPTALVHIHQIVEARTIGKLIRMSVHRRVLRRREMGNKLLSTKPDVARVIYMSAAQLAQAVAYFGTDVPNIIAEGVKENLNSIRTAYQEMVLCLGNACEAYIRMKCWGMAAAMAEHVVETCNHFPPEEAASIGWDIKSSREKNARRLETAKRELRT